MHRFQHPEAGEVRVGRVFGVGEPDSLRPFFVVGWLPGRRFATPEEAYEAFSAIFEGPAHAEWDKFKSNRRGIE